MFSLAVILAFANSADPYFDWVKLDSAEVVERLNRMPVGNGEYIGVSGFNGFQLANSSDGGKSYRSQFDLAVNRAHQKGYKVIAFLSALSWTPPLRQTKSVPDCYEYLAQSAYDSQAKSDYASPLDPFVQKTVLSYFESYYQDSQADLNVIDYRLPRTAIWAYGEASRVAYLREASIDPIDLAQSPSLETGDQPNQPFFDYMAWRLKESNKFLRRLVEIAGAGRAAGQNAIWADPLWSERTISERGAKLSDWIYALSHLNSMGLFCETVVTRDAHISEVRSLEAAARRLGTNTKIWVRSVLPLPEFSDNVNLKHLIVSQSKQ